MNETVKSLAQAYAEELNPPSDYEWAYDPVKERAVNIDVCRDDAEQVLKWLFTRPLTERLTEAEKISVKTTLIMYYNKWRNNKNEATEAVYCAVKEMLEAIFGKGLLNND